MPILTPIFYKEAYPNVLGWLCDTRSPIICLMPRHESLTSKLGLGQGEASGILFDDLSYLLWLVLELHTQKHESILRLSLTSPGLEPLNLTHCPLSWGTTSSHVGALISKNLSAIHQVPRNVTLVQGKADKTSFHMQFYGFFLPWHKTKVCKRCVEEWKRATTC